MYGRACAIIFECVWYSSGRHLTRMCSFCIDASLPCPNNLLWRHFQIMYPRSCMITYVTGTKVLGLVSGV